MYEVRIQRKRQKGWKMPKNTQYVGRPTKWGNPFKVVKEEGWWVVKDKEGNYWGEPYFQEEKAIAKALECYEGHLDALLLMKKLDLNELKGKHLACFCSLHKRCHVDTIFQKIRLLK